MENQRISFIGAGNMASAIISGLIKQGVSASSITASCPAQEQLDGLSRALDIKVTTDNAAAVSGADVVVLAVKPQVLQQVCEPLAENIEPGTMIVSIAAGVEIASIDEWLGGNQAIVRCMPNTPAQVLKGASGLVANPKISESQKAVAEQLFSAIGVVDWLQNESDLHAITALSGSGPAYIFLVIEAMEAAAAKLGIDPQTARKLAAQTVAGAAEMVLGSDIEPGQLKRNVMSPGGTTERAIQVFEEEGLPAIFDKAIKAASDRSEELAALMKKSS